jgi:hypothetical protein
MSVSRRDWRKPLVFGRHPMCREPDFLGKACMGGCVEGRATDLSGAPCQRFSTDGVARRLHNTVPSKRPISPPIVTVPQREPWPKYTM